MSKAQYTWQNLPNGPRLAVATVADSECAAVNILIPAGSRDEVASPNGLAHFLEHMVFKGTARRSARDLSFEVENGGGQINACTSEDQTVYEARGDADLLPTLIDVLADMVWNPTFPKAEIPLEREVIGEEITLYRESPSDHIGDLISAALWPDHPLGRPISGSLASIRRIHQPELQQFHQLHHFRQDLVISVAGPFSPEIVRSLLLPHVPVCRNDSPPPPSFQHDLHPPQRLAESRETDQLQLALAWHTPGRRSDSRHALRLLSLMLGETASSRLFLDLREDSGLCYQISSDVTFFDDTGAFEVQAGLDPDSRDEALKRILAQIQHLAHHGPDPGELERAKRLAVTQSKQAFESTSAHVTWAAECLLDFGHIPEPESWRSHLLAVQHHDIIAAATLLADSPYAMAEICPIESSQL